MRLALKSAALVLLAAGGVWLLRPGASGAAAPAEVALPAGDPGWRLDPLWDDGRAEYCAYEVEWARYGHRYPGRALLILVKEPWNPDLEVKADEPRADGFEVLKLNHVRDVPTGIYTYHQMASVYLRRDTGALRKVAATSSEACGVSTADLVGGRLATRSYFDGQGDRSGPYPAGALPEDGLPALLRGFVAGAPPAELTVFPSLMMGRFAALEPAAYRVRRGAPAPVTVPAGAFEGVELRLENRDGWLAYTFETAPPHRLLAHERGDGTRYELAKCDRLAYWSMHDPGGEAWLPEAVR
jgi:hypothetical protein